MGDRSGREGYPRKAHIISSQYEAKSKPEVAAAHDGDANRIRQGLEEPLLERAIGRGDKELGGWLFTMSSSSLVVLLLLLLLLVADGVFIVVVPL